MAATNSKSQCIICQKQKHAVRCEGCLQVFCYNHLNNHHQEFRQRFDEIQMNCDLFRQKLNKQKNNSQTHILIKQIDKWESDSIQKIQNTAQECRERILRYTDEHFTQMEMNLIVLTDEMREIHNENDFDESDLNQLKQKLTELEKELKQVSNISIAQELTSIVNNISFGVPPREYVYDKVQKRFWNVLEVFL